MDWSNFDHNQGEAWGQGAPRLGPGEYNVRIAKASEEKGILTIIYECEAPAEHAGATHFEGFTISASASGRSERAEEVSKNRLRGMLQAAKAPPRTPPSKWVGLRLSIEVGRQKDNPKYTETKRYHSTVPVPAGRSAEAVPADKFSDDEVPF
jgi:hypothetical protein